MQKINTSMPALVHANQFGGVPGRTCADMYLQMQLELERVLVGEVPDPTEPALRPPWLPRRIRGSSLIRYSPRASVSFCWMLACTRQMLAYGWPSMRQHERIFSHRSHC